MNELDIQELTRRTKPFVKATTVYYVSTPFEGTVGPFHHKEMAVRFAAEKNLQCTDNPWKVEPK